MWLSFINEDANERRKLICVWHTCCGQVPLYITAQMLGATAATLVGVSVYGVNADLMATKPALSCVSAFFVELIATSIVVFLASALHCGPHQNVSDQIDLLIINRKSIY